MITFNIEPVLDCKEEMLSLLDEHYEELTLNKHVVKLNPNWSEYDRREKAGKFVYLTARDGDTLIGYSAWFVDYHIHYADLKVAMNDVIFLKKEYRQGMTGIKLIKYSEKVVRELGVNKVAWHIKESNDFRPILQRMGYAEEDIIVGKII
jgi:hypothetical protein